MNTIYLWNPKISEIQSLEEIHFVNINMKGVLDVSFHNLINLVVLNLC
jgi:hypothetical protein